MSSIETSKLKNKFASASGHTKLMRLLGVLVVLACLTAISGINKPHIYPFSKEIHLKYPTAFFREGTSQTAIDSHGKRMLICEADYKVSAIVDTQSAGSPLDRINGAVIHNGIIYAFGTRQYHKGLFIASEAVVTYNLNGEYQKTLYEKIYKETDFVISKSIKKLSVGNGAVFMTTAEGQKVSVYDLSQGTKQICTMEFQEGIVNCTYNDIDHSVCAIGKYSNCYYGNVYTRIIEPMTFEGMTKKIEKLYGFDFGLFGLDTIDEYKAFPEVIFNAEGQAQFVFFVNQITGKSVMLSDGGKKIDGIDLISCSSYFFIKNLLFWCSVAFLICICAFFIIWFVVKKLSPKGYFVLVVVTCVLFTAFFYTWNEAKQTEKSYNKMLRTDAKQYSMVISKYWGAELGEISEHGIDTFCSHLINRKKMDEASNLLYNLSVAQGTEQPVTIHIFLFDKNDDYLHAFIGAATLISGEKISFTRSMLKQIENFERDKVLTMANGYENFAYGIEPIYNNNKEIGAVVIADYRGNILYTCITRALKLFIGLVTILIGIYVFITTCRTFGCNIKNMLKREKTDYSGRTADMCGFLMFAVYVPAFIDIALVVYIAKTMCVNMSPALQAMLIALPISAAAAGAFTGGLSFPPLTRKFGARTLFVTGSAFTIGALLLTAFSVKSANIYLYIIGRFMIWFFDKGIISTLVYSLPYASKDESVQKGAIRSIIQAIDGCMILIGLISGYIAQYISYTALYLIPVAFVAVSCVAALCVFDRNRKGNNETQRENNSATLSEHWKIYLKTPMIMYTICYTIPWITSMGYSFYLFPLYAASVGMSPLLVSNINVLTKSLVYASGGIIDSITDKMKPANALIVPMLLVCAGFACFWLSPNIYWAVAMSFAFRLLWRAPKMWQSMHIKNIAAAYGLTPQIVQANHNTIEAVIGIFKSPLFALFLLLGKNAACAAIGAVFSVLLALFALYDRKVKIHRAPNGR